MDNAASKEVQSPAVRSFLRSLNILLKSARMYGMDHIHTVSQTKEAWRNLQEALSERAQASLQLAVSENRLLVDGMPLKAGPAERSFVQVLSAADVASITFTPRATTETLTQMVRVFAESGPKAEGLAKKLKEALGGDGTAIVVNEIRFVPADSDRAKGRIAAQILAETLGDDSGKMKGLLNDPQKLLQLIAAVEGTSGGIGVKSDTGSDAGSGVVQAPGEEETTSVIRLLSNLAREGGSEGAIDPAKLRRQISVLPQSSQAMLQQVLAEFTESMPKQPVGTPLLLRVAEHLAVRLAMQRYERGDSHVDAVTEMLNRLNREIETLRETVGSYEQRLKEAGLGAAESPDALEHEFWARAPEAAKLDLMLSEQAWRVPSLHVRHCLERLTERNETEKLENVLVNYVSCIQDPSPEARRKTAVGLRDLATYFPRSAGQPLRIAVRHVAAQFAKEDDPELQKLISAAFVLLGQEATTRRRYPAVLEVLTSLESFEKTHPDIVPTLRARIGLENRIPEFLEEALRVPELTSGLMELLRRIPLVAAEHIAGRMTRCTRRRERDRLVKMAEELGPLAADLLRDAFRSRPPAAAIIAVGLLARLDPVALEEVLRTRLREWSRVYQDAVVRQIAASGLPRRGRLLANILDAIDPLVVPLALDEIGASGDATPARLLCGIAGAESPKLSAPYLRVKAIEALGRLRVKEAVALLRQMVESKELGRDAASKELRIVAAQSLQRIERETAKAVLSAAGIKQADLEPTPFEGVAETPGVRQRYYPRFKFPRGVSAKIITADGEFSASVLELSLGGGLCSCEQRLLPGTPATIRFRPGIRSLAAKIVVRDARSERVAFEIVDMILEERTKLRTLLQSVHK